MATIKIKVQCPDCRKEHEFEADIDPDILIPRARIVEILKT